MKKTKVNYVKVSNKDYTTFYKMLYVLKEKDFSAQERQSEFSYIVESASSVDTIINNESSIISWFLNQKNSIKTESDKTELIGKLNHMEDFIKHILNNQDDDEKRKQMTNLLDDLDWCTNQLELSIEND